MACSRRSFLKDTAIGGAALSIFGMSGVAAGEAPQAETIPTPRAKALMALFGLRYPIFQAPYGGPALASAISSAGAMGAVALWPTTPEVARETVTQMRSQTRQPFIVNYVLSFEPRSLPAALDAGAPVVQFSWGLPSKELVAGVRRAGAKFGVQVGTAQGARAAVDLGADYLVSQGNEAGGHVQSSTPLYDLLPKVLEEAKGTPVLVAGGVAHGAKIRTALMAGASGAVLGTRFVATQESDAHAAYKDALVRADAKDTALSVCFQDGWPGATHRTLRNGTLVGWEAYGCPPVGKRPGEGDVVATGAGGMTVTRYSLDTPHQGFQGTVTDLAMYAGQGVPDVKDIPTARELVERLWAECLTARP